MAERADGMGLDPGPHMDSMRIEFEYNFTFSYGIQIIIVAEHIGRNKLRTRRCLPNASFNTIVLWVSDYF